mgnify:CR=1 FL=1
MSVLQQLLATCRPEQKEDMSAPTRLGFLALCLTCACAVDASSEREQPLKAPALGLHHLPNRVDATNLELREDDAFRWSLAGCDTFGGGSGRIEHEPQTIIALVPEPGRATFSWPGSIAVSLTNRVRLQVLEDHLTELRDNGEAGQSWLPGGVCAVCGGKLGPSGQEACEDPQFF